MSYEPLSAEDRTLLLKLARQSIQLVVSGCPLPELDLSRFSEPLQQPGASFVTLRKEGMLRGCIGALEAYQPLVEDVREHAIAAALEDYRFAPVRLDELPCLHIEISRLTPPVLVHYDCPEDLINCLRPGQDGVVLRRGVQRATFLPQVWAQLPDPVEFLNALCLKMGVREDAWRRERFELLTYQVESFEETPNVTIPTLEPES